MEDVDSYDRDKLLDICTEDIVKVAAKEKVEKTVVTEFSLRECELALGKAE